VQKLPSYKFWRHQLIQNMLDLSFNGRPTSDPQDYLFKSYRAAMGTTKKAGVLSSVHAICSPMTSWGLRILHINNDDKLPRDFSYRSFARGSIMGHGQQQNQEQRNSDLYVVAISTRAHSSAVMSAFNCP